MNIDLDFTGKLSVTQLRLEELAMRAWDLGNRDAAILLTQAAGLYAIAGALQDLVPDRSHPP